MAEGAKPKITSKTPIGTDVDLRQEDVRLSDGTRLTDDVAGHIVEEVRRRDGRPSVTGD